MMIGTPSETPPPYRRLGRAIADARTLAGFSRQGDLAKALAVRQQSVSRWEAGTHRPALTQIPSLAEALKLRAADLRRLAGYDAPLAAGVVKNLPLDALDPEAFEQIIAVLFDRLRPGWAVHRVGKTGHTQGGADVIATDPPTGRRLGVQCKRMAQFGPAQVEAAVSAFPEPMEEKIIALSRVASPQARAQITTHAGWDIWDQDDITRQFRTLPNHVQDQIVESFFPGQNLELLGRTRIGPWQDLETFFRPFSQPGALFTHEWALSGREDDLTALMTRMADPGTPLTVLAAAGGMGKSRLLLEAVRQWREEDPVTGLWFLSTVSDLTRADLTALGPGPKVIIVDDAHDRDTLGALFEFAGHAPNQTRLVLATRPYARNRLVREASVYGLHPATIELEPLKRDALLDLARAMLRDQNKPEDWAPQVVAVAGHSPLIVAMAVRILSREEMAPERIRSDQGLRDYVLGRFTQVVTGRLGPSEDAATNKSILEVLALVQPFHPEDAKLLALIETRGIARSDAERALARMIEGGIALRRGAQHRLMPDVLGDYLIDESCIIDGRLSQFAEEILAASADSPLLLRNIVLNLGRLDWRRTEGETSDSRLLDQVWRSFETITSDYDDRLDAVRAVSVYQPRQALDLAGRLLRQGVALEVVPEILRNIAYTAEYLDEAVALLWEMGRQDERRTGPHPSHPMRVLAEMAAFEDGKPFEINDAMFGFALAQADRDDVWSGAYTPLDLLEPFLATEGVHDESTSRGITMTPFQLRYDVLTPYRTQVVDKLFDLMGQQDPVTARKAALAIQNALSAPHGLMNSAPSEDALARYDAEFIETLERLEAFLKAGVTDLVAMGIAASVRWHADYGSATKSAAQAVLDALPDTLDFRVTAAIADGWGNLFLDRSVEDWPDNVQAWMDAAATELAEAFPDRRERLAYVEAHMDRLAAAGVSLESAHIFIQTLTAADPEFSRALIVSAERRPSARLSAYVSSALFAVRKIAPAEAHAVLERWLDGDVETLRRAAPSVIWGDFANFSPEDLALLRRMLKDRDHVVVLGALHSLRVSRPPDAVLLELSLTAPLNDARVLEQVAMVFGGRREGVVEKLTDNQVDLLLDAMEPLPRLDGHWINETLASLSRLHARKTAAFFRARVMRSMDAPFEFRAANWGAWRRTRLQFGQAEEGAEILAETWDWLRQNWDRGFEFRYGATHLFEAMFLSDMAGLITFFEPQLATAQRPDLELISALLAEADYNFILDESPFVIRFLNRCATFDADLVESASSRLYGAATSGMYSGVPGEPMPRDLSTLERTNAILSGLSRMSAAWTLYDGIRKHAQSNIERSRREGELMDD
ncbi:MAG: restriction endonuclease [Caulobacter sp.]|nr:restriction endonuclease [Caulobacter sp.]